MKGKFILLFIFVFVSILSIRCANEADQVNLEGQALQQLTAKYVGKVNGNGLVLSLLIYDKDKNVVLKRDDIIDISEGYKTSVDLQLKKIATSILTDSPVTNMTLMAGAVQDLIDQYGNTHEAEEMKRDEVLGLFYYVSIFKMIDRYNKELTSNKLASLKCTTYNGYIVGLSPYFAKEDIIINKKMAIAYLSGNPSKLTKQKANIIVDLLKAYNRENFTLLELESLLDVKYHEKSTTLRVLLEGGDCGCCGNYSGHCWMTSIYCWEHDMLCQSCTPRWFCFSGCKPTPCY